jgi:hypothetical protein
LQRLEIYSRHEEEKKELDQQYIMHVSLIEAEQFTADMEIDGSHQEQHVNLELEQLLKEVFLGILNDPIKIYPSEEGWFCYPFKIHFCILGIPLLFGSSSRRLSVNHSLTWLHWKHDFT